MGKSIRAKIKKRFRTAKRQRMDAMVYTPQIIEHHESLKRVIEGRSVTLSKPKNAFKFPKAEGAVFPQHQVDKPIDFRAQNLPMAGYAFSGNRRKYDTEQSEYMNKIKKTHPKMQIMAGGGAILAKDGSRVSMKEAAILATAAERPEAAAMAMAGASSASSAVAEAVAADAASDAEMDSDTEAPEPTHGAADHSRRPVVKDNRRAARAAAHKSRPKSVGVKSKGKTTSRTT